MKSQLQSISIYTESDGQRKIKLSTEKGTVLGIAKAQKAPRRKIFYKRGALVCKARYLSQGIRAGKKLRGHLAQRTHFTDEESDPETRLDLPGLGRHQSHRCFADHIFLVLHRYRYNRYCAPHAAFQFPHRVFETTLQGKGVFVSQFTGEETEAQRVKSFARGHKISAGAPQVHPSSGSRAASPIL